MCIRYWLQTLLSGVWPVTIAIIAGHDYSYALSEELLVS